MKREDLQELRTRLSAARKMSGITQQEAADHLGISRKTYLLFESTRWLPRPRERSHFARKLREIAPHAADELVRLLPDSVEGEVVAPGLRELAPAQAKLVFDSAVLGVAEELEQSPRVVRPLLAAILERLHAGGMPMAQAVAVARAAAAAKPRK